MLLQKQLEPCKMPIYSWTDELFICTNSYVVLLVNIRITIYVSMSTLVRNIPYLLHIIRIDGEWTIKYVVFVNTKYNNFSSLFFGLVHTYT